MAAERLKAGLSVGNLLLPSVQLTHHRHQFTKGAKDCSVEVVQPPSDLFIRIQILNNWTLNRTSWSS